MAIEVLCFELSGRRLAVGLGFVREVVSLHAVTPVPGAPAYVAGLCSVRGQLATVLDLSLLLAGETRPPRPGDSLVILETPPADWSDGQPQRAALAVDRVLEVSAAADERPPSDNERARGVAGTVELRGRGQAELLDVSEIVEAVRRGIEQAAEALGAGPRPLGPSEGAS